MANAARSGARLAQLQRHFSTSSATRKEIQDAYIVGAARTPVGVVCNYLHIESLL
jgi:acetyl-CoA C-acetyltransferase